MRLSQMASQSEPKKETIEEKFEKYKDLSPLEAKEELLKQVANQKTNGIFDYTALQNMVFSLRGTLSEENFQNMLKILETLK